MNRISRTVAIASGLTAFALLTASAQTLATGDSRSVSQPSNPTVCETLTAQHTQSQRSSPPSSSSDDTSRIQSALNSCKNSGHAVRLSANGSNNAFYSEELSVTGESILIDSGVVLYGGSSYSSQSELLDITGTNAGLYGPGTVDGRGDIVSGSARLVQASSVSNLIIYNVTLTQARHPNLYIEGGNGATVWSTTIRTPANRSNADGIDIDSITNVTVNNSSVEAGDDGIAIKTNSGAASNITVENSRFYGTHGISIGSQTFKGVTNVLFNNNYVYGEDLSGNASTDANAINIKTDPDCGGLVKEVYYKNTCIKQGKHLIVVNANYGSCSGTSGTPQFQDIVINGAYSTSSISGAYSTIAGYNSSNLAQVYVANIKLDNNTQSGDENATVYLDNTNGWTPSGSDVTTHTFTLSGSVPSCSF